MRSWHGCDAILTALINFSGSVSEGLMAFASLVDKRAGFDAWTLIRAICLHVQAYCAYNHPMDNSFSLPILQTLRASALIDERFTGALSAVHGVSLREVMLMLYVRNAPGSKLSRIELAKRLCISPSTVTRAAKPLEKIGLIDRKSNSRDARLSYVVLTASGNELLTHAEKTLEQLSRDFLSHNLSEEDRSRFGKILSSLIIEFPGDCL